MSANVPTNPQRRDRDIENKLRLYGIYQAFANNKLPSNKQIDIALSSFANHKKLKNPNPKLSDEGKVILQDFRTVIEEAKRLLLTKNHDEVLQEFIYNATLLGQKGGPQTELPGAPIEKTEADRHKQQGMEGLRTLGQLIITNGQFRKLLNDATILLRDIAGDAATKGASKVNPSADQLDQIDHPAADNEWHESPNFSRDTLKEQFRNKTGRNPNRDELRDVAGNATQAAHPDGSRDPRDAAATAAEDQRNGMSRGIDAREGLRAGAGELRDRANENIPEEHKERGHQYKQRGVNYLKGKMPQERREQTIWRLKKMIVEVQGHQDYMEAIETLISLLTEYSGHAKTLATQGAGTVKGAHGDSHLNTAEQSLKILIERFSNNTSADDLIDAVNDIYRDAEKDPELREWFRSLNTYVQRCLKEQGYILQPDSNHQWDKLYDHGNFLLRNRYRDHTDRLMDEAKFLGEQFQHDPDNRRFSDAIEKLFLDLGNDESGKPVFKKHLIKDISQVILPDIFESIRYVPIPRLEFSDPMVDLVVENMVLESDNLMPNVFEIGNDSYLRWGRKSISSKTQRKMLVSASHIQCDMRDVSYYVNRKQGFPSLSDTGVADIILGGEGFGFKLQLSTADKKDRAHFFKVDDVKVIIKSMKIKLKQSKHKVLFALVKPILMHLMRPAMAKALEAQVKKSFEDMDALVYRVYKEQEKIQQEIQANPDPENIQNIYSRYYQALQTELARGKEKSQAVQQRASQTKVNMAITKEDSIFPNIDLPGGVSTKATEFNQQARAGNDWHNDIFTMGSASPSTSLPGPTPITRKSPHAQRRALRDRDAISTNSTSRDSGYLDGTGAHRNTGVTDSGYGSTRSNDGYGTSPAQAGSFALNKPMRTMNENPNGYGIS